MKNNINKMKSETTDKKHQLPTSCIKHWGLNGYMMYSAPHQLLCRQTGTKSAIPNVSYM